MVFDCKFCTCCLKLCSSELDTDGPVEFFLIEPPEAKTMGAIAQNESPEAKTMGAIAQNEAPEAIWTKLPWKWVSRSHLSFLSKNTKISRDFLRQNVANFNTKLITFWPIA